MKVLFFANTDWYLYNFKLSLAQAVRERGDEVLLVSPPGPYGEKLAAKGFRWIAAPMERRSLNPLRELGLLLWLFRLMRRERVDLVHSFTIKCAVYGALTGRLAGAKRVNAVAGMGYVFTGDAPLARLLRPVVRALMRVSLGGGGARLIIQNSDDVAMLSKAGVAAADMIRLVRGSGVDCARFLPPAPDAANRTGFRVVLASRLLWDKGVGEFVEAARKIKADDAAVEFVLAGAPDPGNPASVDEAAARAWQAEGLVTWLGHVDDMPALFAQADVVALPSYREGLPKSLIEAAACARPLVTTDVEGCREVVTHEIDGLLVPARDPLALAAAIARLRADPALARRLGEAARAKALTDFDERIVIAKTLAVYDELETGRRRAGA